MFTKRFIVEVIKFGLVGSLGFGINYSVLLLLDRFVLNNHVISEIFAIVLALQVTFFLHDAWTYSRETAHKGYRLSVMRRYSSYVLSSITGSVITVVLYAIFYNYIHQFFALAAAAVIGMLWNFCMNRLFIWKHEKLPEKSTA